MDLLTEHLIPAGDALHIIRVAVADDDQLVREGVKKVLATAPGIVVAGESTDLPGTLDMIRAANPDVLLLDLGPGAAQVLDALRTVKRHFPALPVLVLGSHAEEPFGVAVLRLGASGYLCKATAADAIAKAIRKAQAGGHYLSGTLAELLAERLASPPPPRPHERLTVRERDVLRLLALGSAVKQVAGKLAISVSTVNTYRNRIFTKLNIRNNAELIRYAVQHGLDS